jgi:hypothetical protein
VYDADAASSQLDEEYVAEMKRKGGDPSDETSVEDLRIHCTKGRPSAVERDDASSRA